MFRFYEEQPDYLLNFYILSPCTAAPLYKYGGMLRVASNPSAAVLGAFV